MDGHGRPVPSHGRDARLPQRDPADLAGTVQAAHELPGWYETFARETAASVWTTGRSLDGLPTLLDRLPPGPGVVKDYVKSLKHHWDTAMFVPDVRDHDATRRVVDAFLDERAEYLVGGIVVRAFEAYQPGEARTWWVDGQCVLVTAHPDTPDDLVEIPADVLERLRPAVARLGSPFTTADIVRTVDGRHRVVEVGDGQVSDRPRSTTPEAFIHALARR